MSNETIKVLQEQLKVLEIELSIELQKMKVAELGARAKTLIAREGVEDFKLQQMQNRLKEIKNDETNN